jgi:hypothetical protein
LRLLNIFDFQTIKDLDWVNIVILFVRIGISRNQIQRASYLMVAVDQGLAAAPFHYAPGFRLLDVFQQI